MQEKTQERVLALDALRAGAILAVVFIHTGDWLVKATTPAHASPLAAAVGLSRFCVPALVLASGFALYNRYGGRPLERGFLRRRYARVLLPFLAWVPVFALVSLWNGDYQPNPVALATWLLYGAGHLYFLLLVAQLYLVLLVLPRGRRALAALAATALAFQLALGWWHTYAAPSSGLAAWPFNYLSYLEGPYWAGYFLLGCLAAANLERLRALAPWWPALLPALALTSAALVWQSATGVPDDPSREGNSIYLWPVMVPFALLAAAVLAGAGRAIGRAHAGSAVAIEKLSRHSLGVYVLHVGALAFVGRWVAAWPDPLRLPVMIAGALSAGYVLTVLLARTRLGALTVGEPAPSPREGRFEVAT